MPKGNHVFNNFDNTVHNTFIEVLEVFKHADALKAVSGSGGDAVGGAKTLTGTYPNAFKFYNEIINHPLVAVMHAVQDDKPVLPNDPNSKAFGELAAEFTTVVKNWVFGVDGANPVEQWRQMVNIGFDQDACDAYIKVGSSQPGTPNTELKRRERCTELQLFVKGDLSKLATNWMLALRMDLSLAKQVSYSDKPAAWKLILSQAVTQLK